MKTKLVMVVIALWAVTANAVEAILEWNPPTAYTNGEPLPPEQIAGYYAVVDTGEDMIVTETTATFTVDPGTHCFIVQTKATNGLSSVFANLCKDIPGDGPPGQPVFVCP